MYELTVNEQGSKELLLALELAEIELRDWRTVFEKLEPEFTLVIDRRFESEGPGWLRLTKKYEERKARQFPGKTILRRTDKLYLSFAKGNEGHISRIGELSAEFGSSVPYGIFHQEKRPIVEFTGEDENRFMRIATDEKNARLRTLGFDVK